MRAQIPDHWTERVGAVWRSRKEHFVAREQFDAQVLGVLLLAGDEETQAVALYDKLRGSKGAGGGRSGWERAGTTLAGPAFGAPSGQGFELRRAGAEGPAL